MPRPRHSVDTLSAVFDPFDASQSRDSWAVLADLRSAGPVVDVAGGLRYVTRHDACRDVLRDTTAFSNASGMKAPGVEVPAEDRLLGELDPPRHGAVRRVMVTIVPDLRAQMRAIPSEPPLATRAPVDDIATLRTEPSSTLNR